MRIALFTETFLPKTDGIVTTLCQTIRQLRELGHEVLIFAPEGGIAAFEGFPVIGMKSRGFPLYPELRLALPRASMRRVLTEFKPDILHGADPALLGIGALYYGGGKDGGALRVPLVAGFLHKEELACAFASSDVFVMPSRTETLGLVVLEAMASGLPVVAARAAGIPEMIQDGVTGYLVETESEAIERVGALLGSQSLRETMGQKGRAEASCRSWRKATLQLLGQYERASAAQRVGSGESMTRQPSGLRDRGGRAFRRVIVFTVRKLLP